MYTRTYQSTHPDMMPGASNDDLVDRYVIRDLFRENACTLFYTHADRMVVGGVLVADLPIRLPDQAEPASASGRPFLERREMALINVSSHDATVTVDGEDFVVGALDCLYVAMGAKTVTFAGRSARLYLVSCPAHRAHATRLLTLASSNPIRKGEATAANLRTIYQLVIPGTCDSAQLVMGLTILEPGSIWNTVPPHTHDRRSEIYFYFRLNERTDRVFHYMGEPDALRHIVVSNEEAVISPPWSVHMGAGTSAYAFVWAMAGENQDYADMQSIDICQLK